MDLDFRLSPMQTRFLVFYLDPNSETFNNAYQSAIKAGYAEEYSRNLTGQMPKWLSETINDSALVSKALCNVSELLEQNKDIRVKADITKFVLERLHKVKYAARTELTGDKGKDLITLTSEEKEQLDKILNGN